MADFSLTTLFVVPSTNVAPLPGTSTDALAAGAFGIYDQNYAPVPTPVVTPPSYIYLAQGRENTYLQASKRSDKIAASKLISWYKVEGNATAQVQVTNICNFNVKCGEVVTLTLRAHSAYIDTLYFNGFTRSVTVQAPCCDCGEDPCTEVDESALIDQLIAKLEEQAPGINPDNISFNTFYEFSKDEEGETPCLVITGKPLTRYGQPCDVAAFPYEYDRMWFRAFIYKGPATTADFIVADACDVVADVTVVQRSSYPAGTPDEIRQLEKDYYSYQAGYLKHLYRMGGYNYNFESYVENGATYNTYYIKYKPAKEEWTWGDYIIEDAFVIVAVPDGSAADTYIDTTLTAVLGTPEDYTSVEPYPAAPPFVP